MGRFNYEEEPLRDILFIDVKSFYASVECVQSFANGENCSGDHQCHSC